MITGQGTSLQGCTLTERGARVTSADGIFGGEHGGNTPAPNVVECYEDGTLSIVWVRGGTPEVMPFTSGWVNPIQCYSLAVTAGTFNVAWV